jgi:hypothetical protein
MVFFTFALFKTKIYGLLFVCTVGENIIATIKMRNNFCYPLKMVIFPILREQYWTFLYCSPFSYRSSNFAIAKVVALPTIATAIVVAQLRSSRR